MRKGWQDRRGSALVGVLLALMLGGIVRSEPPPAADPAADAGTGGSVYSRWAGRPRADLVAWFGVPTRVERSRSSGDVLVYELRVTCEGSVLGSEFRSVASGVVVGSQDATASLGDPAAVAQGVPRRAGKRVAAEQTVRFFVDDADRIVGHEAGEARTHWKRCSR